MEQLTMDASQDIKTQEYEKARQESFSRKYKWWKSYEGSRADFKFLKMYGSDQGIKSQNNYLGLVIFILYLTRV